jgi:hypothetical protein
MPLTTFIFSCSSQGINKNICLHYQITHCVTMHGITMFFCFVLLIHITLSFCSGNCFHCIVSSMLNSFLDLRAYLTENRAITRNHGNKVLLTQRISAVHGLTCGPNLIIFKKWHCITIVKLLPKFQPPVSVFWWGIATTKRYHPVSHNNTDC